MNSNESSRQFLNGIRKGTVAAVDGALCRVESGDLSTDWIQWFIPFAGESIEWLAPSIGEGVMLLCPSGDPAQAVALRGFYSEDFPPPSTDPAKHMRVYRDGASIEYDMAAHVLNAVFPDGGTVNITAPGAVNVNTKTATVKAETVSIDADTTIEKSLTVKGPFSFESGMTGKGSGTGSTMTINGAADFTGEVKSQGISLPKHKHREQGDGNLVSDPQ
ncbi:phage baseplate assembly protein V [Paraburkholderia diazotrophica]|uniref:Phage baseplate assembly protein V n=1 Tax=Paraburkholderia diazotrophica TaxID=667676 RepID=A0A1H7EIY0_9BURK|nr:phage baseplate assembly protein V [Paraburkholderia diazotrophica]SEK13037.1 phage baseplate assembly protein V [Paraburkholderia diazotrophica]